MNCKEITTVILNISKDEADLRDAEDRGDITSMADIFYKLEKDFDKVLLQTGVVFNKVFKELVKTDFLSKIELIWKLYVKDRLNTKSLIDKEALRNELLSAIPIEKIDCRPGLWSLDRMIEIVDNHPEVVKMSDRLKEYARKELFSRFSSDNYDPFADYSSYYEETDPKFIIQVIIEKLVNAKQK